MGTIESATGDLVHRKNRFSAEEKAELDVPEVWPEMDALLDKIHQLTKANEQLREIVKQLSILVTRNVVGWEARTPVADTIERPQP
jgi:hypothetical protein